MKKLAIFVLAAVYGCASIPTQERVAATPNYDLCKNAYWQRKFGSTEAEAVVFAEIVKRGLLVGDEVKMAKTGQIFMGYGRCALYVAWGDPTLENRTVTNQSSRIQHVYRANLNSVRATYVYTTNDKITAFSN